MNKNHRLKIVTAMLFFTFCASPVFAQEQSRSLAPPPPSVPYAVGNGYLYALIGPAVCQYKLPDMVLQRTVTLPALDIPGSQKSPMPPAHSLFIDGAYLYLVGGATLYQYSLPDLELEQVQALPTPQSLK